MANPEGKPIFHHWKPIEDISGDPERFRDRELEALWRAWSDQRKTLNVAESLAEFNEQLSREWAIETGVIEGIYTLDKGVTQTLIEVGIDSSYIGHEATNKNPELVARTVRAHAGVLEGLFQFVKDERLLSTSYIKELHAQLLKYQTTTEAIDQFGRVFEVELRKGDYKTLANNPTRKDGSIHEFCPPEHTASEMDRLIEIHAKQQGELRPELQAAWLHHAFTQIHPFQDGNGRVARALASLVLIKAGLFPLLVTRDDKARYITSLEAADEGDLGDLVQIFSRLQKRALTRAIGLAIDLRPASNALEAVDATRDLLMSLDRIVPTEWLKAKTFADALATTSFDKLLRVEQMLKASIVNASDPFEFQVARVHPPDELIRALATGLRYEPDFEQYHRAFELNLRHRGRTALIVVSFHGVGESFRGLLAVSAYFQSGEKNAVILSDDILRISYMADPENLQRRFNEWLEAAITKGIELWRRTLV